MKKILLVLASLMGALPLLSQSSDQILSIIEKSAAEHSVYSSRFSEVRTPASKGQKPVTLKGQLEYKAPEYLSMDYDNGEKFLLDGDSMTMVRDGNTVSFDTSKNLLMRGLKHALMYSFSGKLQDLSAEQGADIEAVKKGNQYVVSLTAKKKSARGYSRIIVRYDLKGALVDMQMDEVTGASTFYSFTD